MSPVAEDHARRADRAAWGAIGRLLLVRLDNLGDLLMTTPAMAAVRAGLPGAHIALLASPAGAAAREHLCGIDEVIPFSAPWVKSAPDAAPEAVGPAERELIDRLAVARFDAAIIFTVCTQSALPAALLCRLAGIPRRLAHSRESPYALLSDWVPEPDVIQTGMRHEVQRQLDLVASVGFEAASRRLQWRNPPDAARRLRMRLRAHGMGHDPAYFVVHPGATAASRRYPPERFGQAAALIARTSGLAAVFTGGPQEMELVEQARAAMGAPSFSLAGELPLGELGALIDGARLLVANNTGPVHMAAALGTPVVTLYALTNPQHTPWGVAARVLSHDVPCRNCLRSVCPEGHHDCLVRIEPRQVAQAAVELIAECAAVGHDPRASQWSVARAAPRARPV